MKRKAKTAFTSVLSLLLVVVMVVGAVPIGAFAQGADITNDKSESETELSASTPLGKIVNSQLADAQDNTDYYIADVEMQGNTATVSFENLEQCNLIVAAYNEETLQMLTYSETSVEALQKTADVTVDGELPEHYFVKAFLVDANYAALCKEYVCMQNTTAYEEFLAKTPEDYEGKEIVEFDDEQEDFGVLNDDVVIAEKSAEMTYTYDEKTLTYVFSNANEEVKALKPGDVFYYEYGSGLNEFLLFKVKTVNITDSTVKIVEDEDIGLEEAFDFVRIDEESEASDAKVDDGELGEAFTPAASLKKTRAASEGGTESFSTKLNIKYTKNEQNSVSGSVALKVTVSAKLYYDGKLFGKDYYEFKSEISVKMNITVSFEGSLQVDKDKFCIPFLPIPVGPFVIEAKVYLIAEFSSSLEFEGSLETKITVTADSDNSIKKSVITKNEPGFEVSNKIQLRLGLGVEVKLSLAKIIGLAANGEGGLKFSGTPSTVGVWLDEHHDCITCISGKVDFFYGVGLSLKITIIPNAFSFSWTIAKYEKSYFVCDRYFSYSADGFSCGEGTCPNIEYKVTFTVTDKNGNSVKDVYVSASDGVCDSDADGKFDETYMYTGEDGKAVFYFKKGEHTIELKADSYGDKSYSFNVISNSREFDVPLGKIITGTCGNGNLIWNFDEVTGVLSISGVGGIGDFYSDYDAAISFWGKKISPWSSLRDQIKEVVIEDGVTYIGNYAFIDCSILTNVMIPESVTRIGNSAFYDCFDLTSVAIPDSVTSIGSSAFHQCGLTSVTIPNSVTSIGVEAFYNCESLTSVTIPNSVTSIGAWAFASCDSLTSVTIPNSVTSIDISAFGACSRLTNITVDANNKCFLSVDGVLFNKDKTELIQYPAGKAETSYTIPNSVTSIGNDAFYHCYRLTSVTIPNSVTSIGDWAFYYCASLTSVTIPDSVTSIGYASFGNCDSLTSVTIPNSVTSIGNDAFRHCDSLTRVTIPNSVTSIGNYAFYSCDSLTDVYYSGTEEQWNKISIGDHNSCLTNATIHYNSTGAQAAALRAAVVMSAPKAVNAEPETSVSRGKVVCSGAEAGELYMLYAYVGDMDFKYIDQSVADADGSVTFNYYPMDCDEELTVKVVGKFNGEIQEKSVEPQAQSVSSVALTEDYIELNVGAEHRLKAVLEPLYATNRSVTWSSSDENIVTVDENGVVTAVALGEAEITVTTADGGFTDSCHVRVYQPVQSIEITCGDIEVKKGKTAEVTWLLKTANATDYECVWSSSDESVATVDERGVVTGVKKGEATVTLTVINRDGSTVSDSVNVTVKGSFLDTLLSIFLAPVNLIVSLFKAIIGLFK